MTRSLALSFIISLFALVEADARRIVWNSNPVSGDWYDPANWRQGVVPNGPIDTASFGASTINTVTFPALSQTILSHIVFQTGSGVGYLEISPGAGVTVQGTGITSAGLLTISGDAGSGPGTLTLRNSAVYGVGGAIIVRGALLFHDQTSLGGGRLVYDVGRIEFHDQADATDADISLYPDDGAIPASVLVFAEQVHADGMTLSEAGTAASTTGPTVFFDDDCTAYGSWLTGRQTLPTTFDLSGHSLPGLTVGRLSTGGIVFLGANNLSVAPAYDTTFNGVLHDGGASGGTGGSFSVLAGGASQTFTGPSDYTGGTVVAGSTFYASSSRGSTTGSGPVQVNGGKLAGQGIIAGAVTVGSGTSQAATLGAGGSGSVTGQTLTLQQGLTFRSDGTYAASLSGKKQVANKVAAKGVTIGTGAGIAVTDTANAIVPAGTVFVVISNTATTPIAGRFTNLADGATITAGVNTYQASYEGGDGNDLTLTVQ